MSDIKDNRKRDIENTLCAMCAEHPSTCINEISVPLFSDGGFDEFIRHVKEGGMVRAVPHMSVPTCGICYDQIANYLVDARCAAAGLDFRARHDCDHSFHEPNSNDEGVLKGHAGDWAMYGCPNPLCGELLPGELCDSDPTSKDAGALLIETLFPQVVTKWKSSDTPD